MLQFVSTFAPTQLARMGWQGLNIMGKGRLRT